MGDGFRLQNLDPSNLGSTGKFWSNLPAENFVWFCGNEGRKCIVKFLCFQKFVNLDRKGQRVLFILDEEVISELLLHLQILTAGPLQKLAMWKEKERLSTIMLSAKKNFTEFSFN